MKVIASKSMLRHCVMEHAKVVKFCMDNIQQHANLKNVRNEFPFNEEVLFHQLGCAQKHIEEMMQMVEAYKDAPYRIESED